MKTQHVRALVRLVLLIYLIAVTNGASTKLAKTIKTKQVCTIGVACELEDPMDTVFFNTITSADDTKECIAEHMNVYMTNKRAKNTYVKKKCERTKSIQKRPYVMYDINIAKNRKISENFFRPWHGIHSIILMHMDSERVLPTKLFHNLRNLEVITFFITPAATAARRTYTLPTDIFKTLVDLKVLAFEFTKTSKARVTLQKLTSAHFRHLTALQRLKLDAAHMGALPADIFSKLTQLEYLNLRANNLKVLPPKLLDAQRQLLNLDLSENALEYLPDGLLKHTTALYQLKLNGNRLCSSSNIVQNIRALRYLHKLDLHANHLTDVRGAGIAALFNVHETLMSVFKRTAKPTAQVLEKISTMEDIIQQGDYTKTHLDVSRNRISAFDLAWFNGAPNYLNISENNIKIIEAPKPKLQSKSTCSGKIDIVGNPLVCDCKLTWAHENSCIANLNSVSCSDEVSSRPSGLLTYMHLCARKSATCPQNCVCVARGASLHVTCAGAGLSALPRLPLPEQEALNATQLDISRNRFRALPLLNTIGYASVTHLNASHNEITTLDATQLPPHLMLLDVRHNRLTHLNPDYMRKYFLRSVPLEYYLAGNPWRCDCKGLVLVYAFNSFHRRILDGARLYCANRRNVRVVEVDWRELCVSNTEGLIAN